MNLDNEHSDFTATAALRTMGRHLYDGDAAVKAESTAYLYQDKNEDDTDYDLRLSRAVLDPYVEKIIAARQAVLWRRLPERDMPATLEPFLEDVDRKGTPADVFFRDVSTDAQVDGVHWVLVDMPRAPEAGYPSLGAEQQAGHRPFMQHVPATSVIDWEVNRSDLQLEWAVVKETYDQPRVTAGVEITQVNRWKVWTRTGWTLYELQADEKHKDKLQYVVIDEGLNTSGVVPLVPFLGIRHTDYSGYPVARSIFPHVLAIYNKLSDMDWFERLSAHPIPWMASPEPPTKLDVAKGLHFRTQAGSPDPRIGYLETSGTGFQSLRTSISELKASIYAIALAQARKESAQIQSAESQREDRRIFNEGLRGYSAHLEAQEFRCWQIAAAFIGESGEISITYNADYDDTAIETAMITTLSSLVDADIITRKTLLQQLVRGEVVELDGTVDEELAAVDNEAKTRGAEQAAAAMKALRPDNVVDMPQRPAQQETQLDAGA